MAPHSSTLAWKNPTDRGGAWQAAVHGVTKSDMTERLHFNFSLSSIGEGNGNPFQCSCLENPRDGGAWWAAIYGVAQSRARLKQLSSSSKKLYKSSFLLLCFYPLTLLSRHDSFSLLKALGAFIYPFSIYLIVKYWRLGY